MLDLRTLDANTMLKNISKIYIRIAILFTILASFTAILGILYMLTDNDPVWIGLLVFLAFAAVPLGYAISYFYKAAHPESAEVFKRYGSPEELSAILRRSANSIIYQDKKLIVTNECIVNPKRLESLLPLDKILAAYIFHLRSNSSLTDQGIRVHDIYNNSFCYSIQLGDMEAVATLKRMKQCAPWIAMGYTDETLRYAAANKIKVGEQPPVRIRPAQMPRQMYPQTPQQMYPQMPRQMYPQTPQQMYPQMPRQIYPQTPQQMYPQTPQQMPPQYPGQQRSRGH